MIWLKRRFLKEEFAAPDYASTMQTLSMQLTTQATEFLMFSVPAGRLLESDVYVGLPTESFAPFFDGFVPVKEIDLPKVVDTFLFGDTRAEPFTTRLTLKYPDSRG